MKAEENLKFSLFDGVRGKSHRVNSDIGDMSPKLGQALITIHFAVRIPLGFCFDTVCSFSCRSCPMPLKIRDSCYRIFQHRLVPVV